MSHTRTTSRSRNLLWIAIFAALVLAIGAAFTGLGCLVMNSSSTTTESVDEVVEESAPTPSLGFLYIDKHSVATNEEQAIAVAFDDATTPAAATIRLTQSTTGQTQSFDAVKTTDHAALFTFPASELAEGTWDVTTVDGDDGAGAFTVPVDDAAGDGQTDFVVVAPAVEPTPEAPETTVLPETPAQAEQPVMTAMYVTDDGEVVNAASVDEALLAAAGKALQAPATASSGTIKIALDPGHGGKDPGAIAVNGTYEKDFNWKISNATKNELSQYRGVELFLTRSENECPDIKERVDRAVRWGADVIISQHNNSATNAAAHGAQVYIPNSSAYNYHVHTEGVGLGNAIQAELVKLGLTDRGGNITRDSTNTHYSDGSFEDYYGILRYARYAGKTGIIVEHAFVSNWDDYNNFLSDDGKLYALGKADAAGIAKYYGLSKGPSITWTPTVTAAVDNDHLAANVAISAAPDGVDNVRVVVSKDDFNRTYSPQRLSDGRYSLRIPLSDLGLTGAYGVEVVASLGGVDASVAKTSLTVASMAAATLRIVSTDTTTGTINVEVNASSPVGISEVHLPVWCETVGGQDDLQWYTMTPSNVDANGNGVYTYAVKVTNHKLQSGTYHVDLYVTEKNGIFGGISSTEVEMKLPPFHFDVEPAADGKSVTLTAWGSLINASTPVLFPTWTSANGQDDIYWYGADYDSRTRTWKRTIAFKDHGQSGLYISHCYMTIDNELVMLGSTIFDASTARGTVEVTDGDANDDEVTVKANVLCERGIGSVTLDAWCDGVGGKDDLQTYTMKPVSVDKDGNGIYAVTFGLSDHKAQTGSYKFELTVTDTVGIAALVDATTATLGSDPVTLSATPYNDSAGKLAGYDLAASSKRLTAATPVTFAIYLATADESTAMTYPGTADGAGSRWTATAPLSDFKTAGAYTALAYADFGSGRAKVAEMIFTVPEEALAPDPGPDDYPIMGEPGTSVDQMVRLYEKSGARYPGDVYGSKGAPTVRDFWQIAYDEAVAEGVRPEVLAVQVILETGWLQFGYDVSVEQCNFGGIGATGGGEPGYTFPDVRIGLRAQVQHLKAYASTSNLNQDLVDPRFNLVTRGVAPTVRGLEGRWAMGEGYGDKLLRLLNQLANA